MNNELSAEYSKFKTKNEVPNRWNIYGKYKSYRPESRKCFLCLNKKFEVTDNKSNHLLHRRTAIIAKCQHQIEFKLPSFTIRKPNSMIT